MIKDNNNILAMLYYKLLKKPKKFIKYLSVLIVYINLKQKHLKGNL